MLESVPSSSMPPDGRRRNAVSMAIAVATMVFWHCPSVHGAEPSHLPVYKVLKEGFTASEGEALAKRLGVSEPKLSGTKAGVVEYVDTSRYLAWPKEAATDTVLKSEHMLRATKATRIKDSARPVSPTLLNIRSLASLHAFDEKRALATVADAFDKSGMAPQFGQATVGHHQLSLYSKDGAKKLSEGEVALDTEVTYRFTESNGYPVFGPGAQAQVSFDASGQVSRVYLAARKLAPEGSVDIIPQKEAEELISQLLPPKAKVSSRLVYYAPPLSTAGDASPVVTLIPWYAYYGTISIRDPKSGVTREIKTRIGFIPATRDFKFVPRIKLEASGRTEVQASATVEGGRPPYRFVWGGSNAEVSRMQTAAIRYVPQFRADRALLSDAHLRPERNERISVTVIDANGVRVSASQSLAVQATPTFPQSVSILAARGATMPTFGSENPGTPLHWVPAQVAWNQEMGSAGAGATLSFNWSGDDAWPGDFIRPTPPATLVGTPWINGDADYANWGIDTADIVLDNADGSPDGTSLMYPGAADTDYNTANGGAISTPVSNPDVQIGSAFATVPYSGSWGPVGPNDTLEWLLLDDCDMLDPLNSANLNVAQRWGPAFGGLHVLTGFASPGLGDGPFEGGVADRVLGINGQTAQTIVQAWFNSASATGAGNAAAMGPAIEFAPGLFFSDFNDSFWGKGGVGPTIVPSDYPSAIVAFWYLTSTSPMQLQF